MKIENLKQLEEVIKLCRKTGISFISVDGISVTLTPEQPKRRRRLKTEEQEIETESDYTDEQIALWSAQGSM